MKALFVLCLIATAFSFQTSKQLAGLQAGSFQTLFAQIKEQIRLGSPLSNVMGLLQQLEDQVNKEQAEHDGMLDRNGASCVAEADFRNGEIDEGNAALRRATNHLAACENSRDKAEVDLAQTIQDIADSRAALSVATATREAEHTLFVTRAQDHRNAMNVVKGALNILDDMVAEEAGLVQLSQHTALLLQTGVRINLSHHYAPVIALFAQMATSEFDMFLDAGAVGRIRGMLEQLHDNIQESLVDYSDNESAAQDSFNTLKAKLEQSISDLSTNKVNLEDHLEEMAQCVLEENLLVTKSTEKVRRNTNLLNLSTRMCEAFKAEHAAATESRNEELDLLDTVRKLVRRRLEGLGHAVDHV